MNSRWVIRVFLLFLAACMLSGCAWLKPPGKAEALSRTPVTGPRKIAVFFDGTSNDNQSGTNVSDLFRTTAKSIEGGANIHAFYIEGVGAKGKPIGMATAWGFGERIRASYVFLLKNHRAGDEIYLFGFSRGAYSARALASMLHNVGLPGQPGALAANGLTPEQVADELYAAFKCSTWATKGACQEYKSKRAGEVRTALARLKLETVPVRVRFMGLWDTVEALGWPDFEENVDDPNPRYGDQLCNVDHVAHAVSLDDNRSRIFTPILVTRKHLVDGCKNVDLAAAVHDGALGTAASPKVEEVYFAGAHADVGGGYADAPGQLSGVSLNWMIREAMRADLPLPASAPTESQQPLACTHDPEGEFPFNLLYKRQYRDIDTYAGSQDSASDRLKFHACLVRHIEARPRGFSAYGGQDPAAQELLRLAGPDGLYRSCFKPTSEGTVRYAPGGSCRIIQVGECQVSLDAKHPECK